MGKRNKNSVWTNEEIEILKNSIYKDMSYRDILILLPNKNMKQLQNKCQKMKICDGIRKDNSWSCDELEILRKYFPIIETKEIIKYIPNRSYSSIIRMANRLNLSKEYNWKAKDRKSRDINTYGSHLWSDEKQKELEKIFEEKGEMACYAHFRNKYCHTRKNIKKKLIKTGLIVDIKIKNKNNPTLEEVFVVYKNLLDGKIESFQKYIGNIPKEYLILMFKYYNRVNKINISKDYLINSVIGNDLLEKAKIKHQVKKKFEGYFSFIMACYPNIDLKQWEMKKLDVETDFWNNKYNRFWCIRDGLNKMLKDGIISEKSEVLGLDFKTIYKYTSSSMIAYYGKSCLVEYLEAINDINLLKLKMFNGIRFDSFEEKQVFKFIFENITQNVMKGTAKNNKYINDKKGENYIPDFIIDLGNKKVIIEYFGLFRKKFTTHIYKEYCEKAERKIEFFTSLDNVIFIAIYPEDIKDNFKGVSEKLASF